MMNSRLSVIGLLAAAVVLSMVPQAHATEVSGDQSGTWTLANSPYVVTGWVTVPAGQTLTIEPGGVVKFNGPDLGISVNGILNARGSAGARITFTANGSQAPSAWNNIQFNDGSAGTLEYCRVQYAGYRDGAGVLVRGNAAPAIANSEISNVGGQGLIVYDTAKPALSKVTISGCTEWPVLLRTWSAMPTFQDLTFTGNKYHGVRLENAGIPEGQKMTWNLPGAGIPFQIGGWVVVSKGSSLTVPAGLVVKFEVDAGMNVLGTLSARGTAAALIVFTTDRDDAVGGDTNGDKDASKGEPDAWNNIQFNDGSAGTLEYCRVQYAGYRDGAGVLVRGNAAPAITNSEISNVGGQGLIVYDTAKPALNKVTISGCTEWPVLLRTWTAMPTFQNLTFTGNKYHGVRLENATIPEGQQMAWNHPGKGIPYQIGGWVVVSKGATLTVPAGLVVKFEVDAGMNVLGTLNAKGTAADSIVFTTDRDDAVGGDTNGDKDASKGEPAVWNDIQFNDGSAGTLEYCRVQYAGYRDGGGIVCWGKGAPVIANCEISNVGGQGLIVYDTAKPALNKVTISGCTQWPVLLRTWSAMPTFQNLTFTGNKYHGVRLENATIPEGQQMAWNHPGKGIPYQIGGWVTVSKGATLTVPAGLVVKFEVDAGMNVLGTVTAKGTAEAPIVFTTDRDDAVGGDTNGDREASKAEPAVWNNLQFHDEGTGTLEYCKVRYAGYRDGGGVIVWGKGAPVISNSEISNVGGSGVKVYDTAAPIISPNNSIEKCSDFGVQNNGSATINARNNWWGDASGPLHATLNPSGKGLKVSDKVDFQPYLTQKPGTAAVSVPAISLSVPSLSFDNTQVGSSSQKTFTISNTGKASLSVTSMTVTGTDAAQFQVSPSTATVAAGGNQTITLTFAPTAAGAKSASLSIAHNAAGSPASLSLKGTATQTSGPAIQVSVGSSSGSPGSTVTVPISVNTAKGIAGGDLTLGYDVNVLTAKQVKGTDLVSGAGITVIPNTNTAGQVKVSMAGAAGISSGSGALVQVSFEIKASAGAGSTALTLQANLKDENGLTLPSTTTAGSVNVVVGMIGDVNNDKQVDSGDAILVLRYSAGLATLTDTQKDLGDVNGDQAVDAGDAILVLRYSAGLITKLPRASAKPVLESRGMEVQLGELRALGGDRFAVPLVLGAGVGGGDLCLRYDGAGRLVQVQAPEGVLLAVDDRDPGTVRLSLARAEATGPLVLALQLEGGGQPLALQWQGQLFDGEGEGALAVEGRSARPLAFSLGSYPNPFNASTVIRYALPVAGEVRLTIYSASGAVVRRLVSGWQAAGSYSAVWDGRDDAGQPAGSGLYLGRLESRTLEQTQKMLLLK